MLDQNALKAAAEQLAKSLLDEAVTLAAETAGSFRLHSWVQRTARAEQLAKELQLDGNDAAAAVVRQSVQQVGQLALPAASQPEKPKRGRKPRTSSTPPAGGSGGDGAFRA